MASASSPVFDMKPLMDALVRMEAKIDKTNTEVEAMSESLGVVADRVRVVEAHVFTGRFDEHYDYKHALDIAVQNVDLGLMQALFRLVNFRQDTLNEALGRAAELKGDIEKLATIFTCLIQAGAVIDSQEAIIGAVNSLRIDTLQFFLDRGAKLQALDVLGYVVKMGGPDHLAEERKNVILFLLKKGLYPQNVKTLEYILELYRSNKIDIDTPNELGGTLLGNAAFTHKIPLVEMLLKHGANPLKTDKTKKKKTPIDYAKEKGHTAVLQLFEEHERKRQKAHKAPELSQVEPQPKSPKAPNPSILSTLSIIFRSSSSKHTPKIEEERSLLEAPDTELKSGDELNPLYLALDDLKVVHNLPTPSRKKKRKIHAE